MSKDSDKKTQFKTIATNRRASYKYEILETLEAGIVLTGPEVKSIRTTGANLQDGFARIDGDVASLWNVHILPYAQGSLHVTQEPTRTRRLLLHLQEIRKLVGKTTIKGLTLIPLEIYFNPRGKVKVKLALAKGKTGPDRREDIKRKTVGRELQREFAGKHRLR